MGAVLFAKRLDDFEGLFRKAPRVFIYDGIDKLTESRQFKPGVKGYALGFEGLIDFINAHIPSNRIVGKALHAEIKMYSEGMIRELVANALIHQDFNETGTSVTIEIYRDRVEISNPGKSIISPKRMIDEHQSRNEKLADLTRRLGMCEEQGMGIDKVVNDAEVLQLPAPDFWIGERHTVAVIFAHKEFDEMDAKDRVRACYQHCVLRWLMQTTMDNQSLRDRFQLPETRTKTVSIIILKTMEQGDIKLVGSNTSRRYAKYVPSWA
jgi:ATP-dependent DNA helicase RecG